MQKILSRHAFLLVLAAFTGIGAFAGSFSRTSAVTAVTAPTAVAVVNVRKVMSATKEYAALGEMQKSALENFKKQGTAKDAELKALQENAKLLTAGSDEWQKLDAQYTEKTMQLEAWVNFQKKQLARQEAAMMLGLYKKVCLRAQKLAEDKGYDLLLAQNLTNEQLKDVRLEEANAIVNGDREVLWAKKNCDLSEDLRAAMDNEFAQRGAPAAAPSTTPAPFGPLVVPAPK